MNAKIWILALWAMLWPTSLLGQGFAGLGTDADGFALPKQGYVFDFPADHGPHPNYRIEWWYVTATLNGPDGTEYGLQWTLFRSALAPEDKDDWDSPQIWLAHAAVTTPNAHYVAEKFARGGIGQAGVVADPFRAWIDDWEMGGDTMLDVSLRAGDRDFGYDVRLSTDKPFVPQGNAGYSVKSAGGQASYYYSQPFYTVSGTLRLPEGPVEVKGQAWLDREWSSQPLSDSQDGWDWFSLAFDDGARLMGFRLRDREGADYTAATWIEADGTPTPYPDGAFSAEPLGWHEVANRDVPVRWRVTLPDRNVDVEVDALNPNAWMGTSIAYWEGPIRITGSHQGRGYLEMTGYE